MRAFVNGNQTLIKTPTGVWSVTYNAENRPVRWVKDNIVITMNFDRMGRRTFYKEEVNGVVTKHHKFVYDNYLCVQKVDALNNNAQINLFVWDPTEPIATRPLFTTGSGNRKFFYTCDGNKNVSELVHFETRNGIAAHYDYAPFGAITRAISASTITDNSFTTDNPFRFSSEYHDDTLGLVYYNYRHYNPTDARWCGRDRYSFKNLYYFKNGILGFDSLGNKFSVESEWLPMVEIDQIARSLDDEPDDPMRVYRGATLVVRAGWRSPGIIFLSTSSSEGCICAEYSYPEYDIELRQLLPNNHVDARGRIYTERGRDAIVGHETRRVLVYALAYNAYYREYEGGGKTKTFCASNEEDLSKEVNKLDKVVKEYIEQNQDLIAEEDLTPKMVKTDNRWEFDGYLNPHRVLRPQSLD